MPESSAPAGAKPCDAEDIRFPTMFETVLHDEMEQMRFARQARDVKTDSAPDNTLIGLAFSGGGIRSATFNLGILQALARNGLLNKFDYLSTVSGGGYIGSWLAALTYRLRLSGQGFSAVLNILKNKTYDIRKPAEDQAVRWLRNYSSYLTPRTGILTGDSGAVAGNWLRNVILNQMVVILFLLGVIMIPSFLVLFTWEVSRSFQIAFFAGVLLLVVATVTMSLSMGDFESWAAQQKRSWPIRKRVPLCIAMFFMAACLMNGAMWMWPGITDGTFLWWTVGGAIFHGFVWLLSYVIAKAIGRKPPEGPAQDEQLFRWPPLLLGAVGSGLIGGAVLNGYGRVLSYIPRDDGNAWLVIIFGTVALMLLVQFVAVLQLGLLGNGCVDLVREWWARAGGRLLQIMLVWVTTFGIVIFGPLLVLFLMNSHSPRGWSISALATWVASILGGIGAGKSARTSGQPKAGDGVTAKLMNLVKSPAIMEVVARVAPYIFLAGLLVLLSTAVRFAGEMYLDPQQTWGLWAPCCKLSPTTIWYGYWALQSSGDWFGVLLAAIGLVAIAALLSQRVDVNDFSMHHFYRNRLVRCYLGASNKSRKPQSFTGFDPGDEIALADLMAVDPASKNKFYPGLYPILNGTMNVTRGGELGFQKRKAKPFTFTPLYCGYDVGSYQPTDCGRSDTLGHNRGMMLGTSMAISGAAVSPNMGFHTSPATAFFLTLFDVRLGWWMGNPRQSEKWKSSGPTWGLAYLLSELMGSADETSSYVYLSDGAHFENLGIYGLIERRCRLILVCDCGEDGSYGFGDLMSAIEKVRTDFGVSIKIDVSDIKPKGTDRESDSNFAIGKIHYGPEANDCGFLIYVKASLPKDVTGASPEHRTPSDVISYANTHECFPHQSTGDQWFDEVQFESYRALGEYIGNMVINDGSLQEKIDGILAGATVPCGQTHDQS